MFAWTERVCSSRGWTYEVWSGGDPVVLANVRAIAAARRPALVDSNVSARVTAVWRAGMTIDDVVVAAAAVRRARSAVLAGIWSGVWTVDMTVPLSGRSVLKGGRSAA